MMLKFLPDDINIEDVISYLPKDSYCISVNGVHKRNSYNDIIGYEETDGKTEFCVGRNSLYNSLPEYMFHPVNRFDNIPERDRKDRFDEECEKQRNEKENARNFFAPIDVLLLELRAKVKECVGRYASENIIMQEIIGDSLTEKEKANRFIRRAVPFLPNCKRIRGNRTLITLLLRKVLFEEGLFLKKENPMCEIKDSVPQYGCGVENCQLGALYVGNEFCENITTYTVQYWSDEECTEHFDRFLEELEGFRLFIQDYFLSIEDRLCFNVVTDYPPLRLSDEFVCNYLNFNANL